MREGDRQEHTGLRDASRIRPRGSKQTCSTLGILSGVVGGLWLPGFQPQGGAAVHGAARVGWEGTWVGTGKPWSSRGYVGSSEGRQEGEDSSAVPLIGKKAGQGGFVGTEAWYGVRSVRQRWE